MPSQDKKIIFDLDNHFHSGNSTCHFTFLAGAVIAQTIVFRTTASDSPNSVQLSRHFAKPRGVIVQAGDSAVDNEVKD